MANKMTISLDSQKNKVSDIKVAPASIETHILKNPYVKTDRSKQPRQQMQPQIIPLTIQMIRREFDLPKDVGFFILLILYFQEELFDDFGCTLKSNLGPQLKEKGTRKILKAGMNNIVSQVRYQGRLYITEQHMCFNSNFMGITYKNVSQGFIDNLF
jgi:hypothetical protein